MLPFKEVLLESNNKYDKFRREFSGNLTSEELNWHRDKENRIVEVISGSGWFIQFENELPIELSEGISFKINRNKWHRIINKNGKNLVIEIRKYKWKQIAF